MDVAELADLLLRQALLHELLLHRPDLGARDVADKAGEARLQRVDVAAAVQVADDVLQDLLLRGSVGERGRGAGGSSLRPGHGLPRHAADLPADSGEQVPERDVAQGGHLVERGQLAHGVTQ